MTTPGLPEPSRPWTPETVAALDRIRQGHVFDGIPLLALGPAAPDTELWVGTRLPGTPIAGLAVLTENRSQLPGGGGLIPLGANAS